MVSIECQNIKEPAFLADLKLFCLKAAKECAINEHQEFSIVLTNNETIQEYNYRYRQKEQPTDVLTFAACDFVDETWPTDDTDELEQLGDIIISLDAVTENERFFDVNYEEELKRLVVHGILHLLGNDHQTNNLEEEEMLQKQELIVKKLEDSRIRR